MNIRPIRTKKDYAQAMERLEKLFDSRKGSAQGDELEILSILIERYEEKNFPIDLPDPIEAIKFRMEQMNFNQSDLGKVVGLKSRASEILSGKRKLTLDMIRKINHAMRIPTDVLIKEY